MQASNIQVLFLRMGLDERFSLIVKHLTCVSVAQAPGSVVLCNAISSSDT